MRVPAGMHVVGIICRIVFVVYLILKLSLPQRLGQACRK
jgi:hypothetical protein